MTPQTERTCITFDVLWALQANFGATFRELARILERPNEPNRTEHCETKADVVEAISRSRDPLTMYIIFLKSKTVVPHSTSTRISWFIASCTATLLTCHRPDPAPRPGAITLLSKVSVLNWIIFDLIFPFAERVADDGLIFPQQTTRRSTPGPVRGPRRTLTIWRLWIDWSLAWFAAIV